MTVGDERRDGNNGDDGAAMVGEAALEFPSVVAGLDCVAGVKGWAGGPADREGVAMGLLVGEIVDVVAV